jgi:hypothetical protein
MLDRVPQLIDEAVCENFLRLGVVWQTSNERNSTLHQHRLVILMRLSLDLLVDDVQKRLDVCPTFYLAKRPPFSSCHGKKPTILAK